MFYSPSKNGFYTTEIHTTMPVDVVEINAQKHAMLMRDQSAGMRIQPDTNGVPIAVAVPVEPPTLEQLRDAAKADRAFAVAAIKVTTQAGHTFDGDEVSQGRMSRAIMGMQAANAPSIIWVLANNVPTAVTVAELMEALVLSGQEQGRVWILE